MEPLLVTAYTPAGFATSDPWSPSLDGILAYWLLRDQLGEERFALGMTGQMEMVTPSDLPLERLEGGGTWWWACSSPQYERRAEYLHYYHRRFDSMAAERFVATGKTGRIATSAGPYKQYRQAHRVVLTPWVRWHCLGDAGEIRRLLRLCASIGGGHSRGVGRVTRWEVTAEGASEEMARYHRPLPEGYAVSLGMQGPLLEWGIRPPGRAPENRCLCVMPCSDA